MSEFMNKLYELSKDIELDNDKIKYTKLTKDVFNTLKEEDILFISNPGRMGDEDGSNIIIKVDNDYYAYRISGWMYGPKNDDYISLTETQEHFPNWKNRWENWQDKKLINQYEYVYMGFGNGISINKNIYNNFYPYIKDYISDDKLLGYKDLDNAIKNYLNDNNIELK